MPYVSLDNLSQFWGNAKKYIDERDGKFANWQKTETAGAVAFYPVPETALEPVVDFLFTETGPAEGTKAPDNPSTITGVSSVKVTRCGKNILALPYAGASSGQLTYSVAADGIITINGTTTSNNYFYFNNVYLKAGTKLSIGAELANTDGTGLAVQIVSANSLYSTIWQYLDSPKTVKTIPIDGYVTFRMYVTKSTTLTNAVIKPQYELGESATEYEAPMQASEAGYTIDLNGTYYGGTIDLATGLMTVTWKAKAFDGTENWLLGSNSITGYNVFYYTGFYMDGTSEVSTATQTCTHYPLLGNLISASNHFYITSNRTWFVSTEQSVDDFKAFLAQQNSLGTPVTVVCRGESQTTQLTPTQILALPQADKYTPRLNTVYTDASAVQVGYPKSPQASQAELANAIISLGSNI